MNSNLITKYRPQSFADVIGQDTIVRSLQGICKRRDAQIFLFSGMGGVGKTTLAKLTAKALGADEAHTMDVNAASKTGVEDVRQILDMLEYRPFGYAGKRAIIVDEAHRLSPNAMDSLLKALEDPPEHVIWCFCTTNPSKLPKTLQSRCAKFELKPVADKALGELYDFVCEQEKLDLPGDVGDLLIKEAKGSPRQLLSNMVVVREAKSKKEAAELLRTALETDSIRELCQFIINGSGSWATCMKIVGKIEDPPESVRIIVCNYIGVCLKNAKSDDAAAGFMQKLDAFAQSYNSLEGIAPLLLSIGRALFAE